ncbi:hypothetical protein AGLY_001893 [Aphis glycines]|uniref:Uncharacterized protein n=1 Tax=Aphis glycines TaxID=307491 RepID=A0A6G0U475_APHGL|nr:hypothetical protein AGLY_001893 [Aphis glycines]
MHLTVHLKLRNIITFKKKGIVIKIEQFLLVIKITAYHTPNVILSFVSILVFRNYIVHFKEYWLQIKDAHYHYFKITFVFYRLIYNSMDTIGLKRDCFRETAEDKDLTLLSIYLIDEINCIGNVYRKKRSTDDYYLNNNNHCTYRYIKYKKHQQTRTYRVNNSTSYYELLRKKIEYKIQIEDFINVS